MFGQTFTTDIMLISLLVFGIGILIIATRPLHQSFTSDRIDKVQGLHQVPVPRIGGLPVVIGIITGLWFWNAGEGSKKTAEFSPSEVSKPPKPTKSRFLFLKQERKNGIPKGPVMVYLSNGRRLVEIHHIYTILRHVRDSKNRALVVMAVVILNDILA